MDMINNLVTPVEANSYKLQIHRKPVKLQADVLAYLVNTAKHTQFGQEHNFISIKNYQDFKNNVPIREYKDFAHYFDLIFKNNNNSINVLWPGKPEYLITSSATTGAVKYLPATQESLKNFTSIIIKIIMQYVYDTNDFDIFNSKFMSFTGSPNLHNYCNYLAGPISGITRTIMPNYIQQNSLPSKQVIDLMDKEGWDVMFKQAAHEAANNNISICSGLPSWMTQFFNACTDISKSNKLSQILPNLKLLLTSGVNYRPYQNQFNELFDHKIQIREMYAASEGLFAYQDSPEDNGMLLNLAAGIYFEFIENNNKQIRVNISEVKLNTQYIIAVSTAAGLWGYKTGDIIEFVSISPPRIKIIGRTYHFISIQTEDVYAHDVEAAIQTVNAALKIDINNFTVTPNDIAENCMPYYNWYIETPHFHGLNIKNLAQKLDQALINQSADYAKSRNSNRLAIAKLFLLKPGAFLHYLTTKNSSSLQLKIPKVMNDRSLPDYLIKNNLIIEQEVIL